MKIKHNELVRGDWVELQEPTLDYPWWDIFSLFPIYGTITVQDFVFNEDGKSVQKMTVIDHEGNTAEDIFDLLNVKK